MTRLTSRLAAVLVSSVSCNLLLIWLSLPGAVARAQTMPGPGHPAPAKRGEPPPVHDPFPPPLNAPEWSFGLDARMPIIKGDPASFNPDVGLGIGAHAQRLFRSWFRLRFAVDHDRIFSRSNIAVPGLGGATVSRSQNLTSTAFLVQPTFRLEHKWFGAHLSVGAGLFLAFFNNAEVEESRKVDRTSFLPGLRLEAGFTFRVHKSVELGLGFSYDFRRDYTRVPTSPEPTAPQRRVFDDQMSLALRVDYLF